MGIARSPPIIFSEPAAGLARDSVNSKEPFHAPRGASNRRVSSRSGCDAVLKPQFVHLAEPTEMTAYECEGACRSSTDARLDLPQLSHSQQRSEPVAIASEADIYRSNVKGFLAAGQSLKSNQFDTTFNL
jgi:hypothetical protein